MGISTIETTSPVAFAGLLLIAAIVTFAFAGLIISIFNQKK